MIDLNLHCEIPKSVHEEGIAGTTWMLDCYSNYRVSLCVGDEDDNYDTWCSDSPEHVAAFRRLADGMVKAAQYLEDGLRRAAKTGDSSMSVGSPCPAGFVACQEIVKQHLSQKIEG